MSLKMMMMIIIKIKKNNKTETNNAFETNLPSSIKTHETWSKWDKQKTLSMNSKANYCLLLHLLRFLFICFFILSFFFFKILYFKIFSFVVHIFCGHDWSIDLKLGKSFLCIYIIMGVLFFSLSLSLRTIYLCSWCNVVRHIPSAKQVMSS